LIIVPTLMSASTANRAFVRAERAIDFVATDAASSIRPPESYSEPLFWLVSYGGCRMPTLLGDLYFTMYQLVQTVNFVLAAARTAHVVRRSALWYFF
jgi:hypothetical protein